MVLPTNVRCAILAAALSLNAAAQPLVQAQELRAQGHYPEARAIFTSLLHDAEKNPADTHAVATILDNLGTDENAMRDYSAAENSFNRALAVIPMGDPSIPSVQTHLAELYVAENRPADAEPLLRLAAAGFRSANPPNRAALAVAYNDLAVAAAMRHKRPEAETLLRQGLALLEEEVGPNHPMVLSSLNPMAELLLAEHRYADAVAPAERAWSILQATTIRVAAPDRASVLDLLGQVYVHTGRLKEAESCERQAVDIAEAAYGPQHPILAGYLTRYAGILSQTDHKKQAKDILKRAQSIAAQGRDSMGGYTVSASALR